MLKSFRYRHSGIVPLGGLVIVCAASTQLSGCVVREVVVPESPPAPAYVAPAPAAAPVAEAEVQASEPPPPLPQYEQPPCPVEGYLWTPGYWAWGGGGYYWVPGTWVAPPQVGLLWTPGYWAFVGGVYTFHAGYWGPHVGFYGGVAYGHGYNGDGYAGGRWVGNSFAYNQSVTNVNTTVVHNTYNQTVINNVTVNRVSYNGGAGGTVATPTAHERMAAQEVHVPPTPAQHEHIQQAATNSAFLARNNGGRPAIAATAHPGAFNAPGIVGAHGAPPPQANRPYVGNRSYGGLGATGGAGNGAHPSPYAAHPQPANGAGRPASAPNNVARSHPTPPTPRNKPEKGQREETAQR
jgi:hypothetical protein